MSCVCNVALGAKHQGTLQALFATGQAAGCRPAPDALCLHAASQAAEAAWEPLLQTASGSQASGGARLQTPDRIREEMAKISLPPSLSFEPNIQVSQRPITFPCLQACMLSHVCAQ